MLNTFAREDFVIFCFISNNIKIQLLYAFNKIFGIRSKKSEHTISEHFISINTRNRSKVFKKI